MRDKNRTKRRILTAGAGAAVFTALEGLACGNPVEPPRNPPKQTIEEPPAPSAAPSAAASAAVNAGANAR